MEKENVTFFAGVPTMWWNLLHALHPGVNTEHIAGNLRVGVSGGASLPVDIINQIESKLGVTIFEGYGLSEVTTAATFNQPGRPAKPGSVGTPVWGVECKLIRPDWSEITSDDEIAEIAIRGPNVMKGYYNRPEETAEAIRDGWFRSGDLARRDSDGYYYIVDRSKDMIIRGGYNVYPREIEEVLTTHPDVSLAAVIGVPHTTYGEEIKAYVIRSKGSTISETELIAWANSQVAAYKYPRIVEFVDSLPLTATGKILKRQLT
jgi:long-chain acyl-CoA synthetase